MKFAFYALAFFAIAVAAPVNAQVTPFNIDLAYTGGAEAYQAEFEAAEAVWERTLLPRLATHQHHRDVDRPSNVPTLLTPIKRLKAIDLFFARSIRPEQKRKNGLS